MSFKGPREIVEAACRTGCAKAKLSAAQELALGFLAGAFIAFGGLVAIVIGKGSPVLIAANPGLAKLLFAAIFPVGFVMVIIAGAELFTDNCALITPACLTGAARWKGLAKNWVLVFVGNVLGSIFVALFLAYWSGIINGGVLGQAAAKLAEEKVALNWGQLILRGVGGNWLVGLAIWVGMAADDVIGKIWGMWFPVMAWAAIGFEHSIANAFFIPLGMLNGADITVWQFLFSSLLPVMIGNIIGGAGFVGVVYWWWLYGRD